jgi:hypothetical protein
MQNVDLKGLYNYDEFDKIITYLKQTKLETIANQGSIISKTLTKLQQIENPDKIVDILLIIANYKQNVFINELKEGIRILTSMQ